MNTPDIGKFEDAWAIRALGFPFALKVLVVFPGVEAAPIGYAAIESSAVVIPASILHTAHTLRNARHPIAPIAPIARFA